MKISFCFYSLPSILIIILRRMCLWKAKIVSSTPSLFQWFHVDTFSIIWTHVIPFLILIASVIVSMVKGAFFLPTVQFNYLPLSALPVFLLNICFACILICILPLFAFSLSSYCSVVVSLRLFFGFFLAPNDHQYYLSEWYKLLLFVCLFSFSV